jgi:hypothetical protein
MTNSARISLYCTILFILSVWQVQAQSLRYETKGNYPDSFPKWNLYFQYAQLEINTSNFTGSSVNMGLWGHYQIQPNKLQIDLNAQRSAWVFGNIENIVDPGRIDPPGNTEVSVGVSKTLKSTTAENQQIKLGFHANISQGRSGGSTFRITRKVSLLVPGSIKRNMGYRGGLYFKSNLYQLSSYNNAYTNLINGGVYGGVYMQNIRNLFVNVQDNGTQFKSFGQTYYLDLLILPINSINSADSKYSTAEIRQNTTLNQMPLGFRVGYRYFQTASKNLTKQKYGLGISGELGYRPYHGAYFAAGIAVALKR